jgi:hydrogenase maturation protease
VNGTIESTSQGTLILGWGNPGRRDDGLGPALVAAISADRPAGVTVETDYQLQVEDAAEVARYGRVFFVDADRACPAPYSLRRLEASERRMSFSTHSVAPEAILALTRDLFGANPEAWLLGIRGYEFDDFGEGLSVPAQENLQAAVDFVQAACDTATEDAAGDTSLKSEDDSCTMKDN